MNRLEHYEPRVDEILQEKSPQAPITVPEPGPPVPAFGIFGDDYLTAVEGMFALPGQAPRPSAKAPPL